MHPARPPVALDKKLGREDARRDALVAEAWRLIGEALETGAMTLKSGATVTLDAKDQLRVANWLATLDKKRPSSMPLPKDIFLPQTG